MPDDSIEKRDKLCRLAEDILYLSRNTLLVNLRFLDVALSRLKLFPIDEDTLLTDGRHILYNPRHVLTTYKSAREIPVRDYLHMVLHCVFQHMYMDPALERSYWDLACDIAVENVIRELALKAATAPREAQQGRYIEAIRYDLKHVTAEKIYLYLRQTQPDAAKIAEIRGIFYADNHEIWYMTGEEKESHFGLAAEGSGEADGESQSEAAADWQSVAERMQVDLETFGKQRGLKPGAMTQILTAVNREKYDYSAFLKNSPLWANRCASTTMNSTISITPTVCSFTKKCPSSSRWSTRM